MTCYVALSASDQLTWIWKRGCSLESEVRRNELAPRSGCELYDPLYSCCNRYVAGIQISTVVAPRRCGKRHLCAPTWRVRVSKCRRSAATNTTRRRLDVF